MKTGLVCMLVLVVVVVALLGTDAVDARLNPVCSEPKKAGPCRAAYRRFFYNERKQTCESLIWGGCRENGNNFETLAACRSTCELTTVQGVCSQPKKVGPCRAFYQRYFYNEKKQTCESFIWGGCRENGNNFETLDACRSTCELTTVQGGFYPVNKPLIVSHCHGNGCKECQLPPETGMCRGLLTQYYYNHETGRCQTFVYGGCGGNANNFDDVDSCMAQCRGGDAPLNVLG